MHLMKRLMMLSLSQNIHFRAKHIPGIANTAADLLSRLQVQDFVTRFPHKDKEPTQVPESLIKILIKQQMLVRSSLFQSTA